MSSESASRKRPFRLRFHGWIRWIHTYLSMITFVIVLFFSITGITLNHPEWTWGSEARQTKADGTLDRAWLASETPDWFHIAESLRSKHHLRGIADEPQADEREASMAFKAPGYHADVFIERETGKYEVSVEAQGPVAVMNDLHRGRDSGSAWSWTIDLSGAFLVLISLTGIGMVFYLKKIKVRALLTVAAGLAIVLLLIRLAM